MQLDLTHNYFEMFDLPVDFRVDQTLLHDNHQMLQSAFHPDRYINSTEQEKRLAVQQAALINEAYETLHDPVKRARYMLEVSGLELNDDHETTSDTEFLMEQIELREEMDECRTCGDPMRCCDHITGKLDQRSREFSSQFDTYFKQGELEKARQISKKMQFVHRILEQLDEYQLELETDLL